MKTKVIAILSFVFIGLLFGCKGDGDVESSSSLETSITSVTNSSSRPTSNNGGNNNPSVNESGDSSSSYGEIKESDYSNPNYPLQSNDEHGIVDWKDN